MEKKRRKMNANPNPADEVVGGCFIIIIITRIAMKRISSRVGGWQSYVKWLLLNNLSWGEIQKL